jgi:hypothetical protein
MKSLSYVRIDATTSVVVREVKPHDFEAWLSLWDGYNAFYGRAGATGLARNYPKTWGDSLIPSNLYLRWSLKMQEKWLV